MNDIRETEIEWESIVQRPRAIVNREAIGKVITGHRVLVTGASGSLGTALSEFLAGFEPEMLIMYDWHESSMFKLRQRLNSLYPDANLRFVLGDIRNRAKVHRVMTETKPEVVFHLAAYKQLPWAEEDPAEFVSVNVQGALNILDEALLAGVHKFVYPSTDKAVEAPSLYGATKKIVEELLKASSQSGACFNCGIIRFVNVLGSQGSVSETFTRQAKNGETFRVTHERMDRYWITPLEATLSLVYAACLDDCARVVVPDTGEAILVTEVARRIWQSVASPEQELRIEYIGLREGERLHEELAGPGEILIPAPYSGIMLVEDTKRRKGDLSRIRASVDNMLQQKDDMPGDELKKMVLDLAHSLGK
jgi:FlaA1/EpsC-like NDP-sugar epimerase